MTVQGRQDWGSRMPKSRMLTFVKQAAKETGSHMCSCFISRGNLTGTSCTRDNKDFAAASVAKCCIQALSRSPLDQFPCFGSFISFLACRVGS